MKKIIILLLLNSCAHSSVYAPTHIAEHNIKIYDNTTAIKPTLSEINLVIKYITDKFGNENLNGTRVYLSNDWVKIPQPSGQVKYMDGYTDIVDKVILASVFQNCFADSGFVHELLHIIHDKGQVPDWWHDDKPFWERVKQLEIDIIIDLCPADYKRKEIVKPKNM